ncbi:MAG: hypothetical protein ABSG79_02480 [Bryobacteraceae bacterium]|jgi:hypothetical protein
MKYIDEYRDAKIARAPGPPTRTGRAVRGIVRFLIYNNFYGLHGIKDVML